MQHQPPTLGGMQLRTLREQIGKTQLLLEADAGLGSGYVQRIESGKVQQPERATLERILTALAAGYNERREILALFGYATTTPVPTDEEIRWARQVSHTDLHGVMFPAYLLDCLHRLLAWNRYIPNMIPAVADDHLQAQGAHWSIFHLWFDPRYQLTSLVQNPDTFFAQMVHTLQHEMHRFGNEPWYPTLIDQLMHELPRFRQYWERRDEYQPYASAARALVPLHLHIPENGCLQFRLTAERFTRDARFRIVYFFPADPYTIRQCAVWASEQ
jgi:transcriptional regulator with XRE-family HTH domain